MIRWCQRKVTPCSQLEDCRGVRSQAKLKSSMRVKHLKVLGPLKLSLATRDFLEQDFGCGPDLYLLRRLLVLLRCVLHRLRAAHELIPLE